MADQKTMEDFMSTVKNLADSGVDAETMEKFLKTTKNLAEAGEHGGADEATAPEHASASTAKSSSLLSRIGRWWKSG